MSQINEQKILMKLVDLLFEEGVITFEEKLKLYEMFRNESEI